MRVLPHSLRCSHTYCVGPQIANVCGLDGGCAGCSEQDDAQQQGLSWFNFQRNEGGVGYTLSLVDESIAYIANICREQGPFDGILGFSQGGTIASLVLQRQRTLSPCVSDEWRGSTHGLTFRFDL